MARLYRFINLLFWKKCVVLQCEITKTMENVLSDIKQLALEVVPSGGEAWLYGSRARGKEKLTQSDYDTVSYPFVLLGCELGEEINPIMYTEQEWQSYRATPFYENVQHDAVNLLQ